MSLMYQVQTKFGKCCVESEFIPIQSHVVLHNNKVMVVVYSHQTVLWSSDPQKLKLLEIDSKLNSGTLKKWMPTDEL